MKSKTCDDFPWEGTTSQNVGMASADKLVANKVNIGMGSAKLAICSKLHVGMGSVSEAIVFDAVHVGMGGINHLHCLHSTSQHIGMSKIGVITFYSREELIDLALERSGWNVNADTTSDHKMNTSAGGKDNVTAAPPMANPCVEDETDIDIPVVAAEAISS
eukprot:111044_1